ncbi:hypothetical protein FT663_01941 [Candidozyma haemuli var. vulneris]|uniref:Small GTP-binding protein domain n=1 Tax=Candidozyma haemuli TaxID=45357 RepID=A0A2V1AVS1_9ASCO|nr:hypothetical protein CXQ85_000400 [[Candida] haemuloni]KAF3987287.1 hypothetical protein FT662_04078 [[Candida] haemuloni var. vulneris]KAF3993351.1 hypothetical protein FT663_01941 [[Candida] haemuloni var. vulneris]PVH21423.1 hypothetical protein CXQ85_000400 [[Candida] haemuloni]
MFHLASSLYTQYSRREQYNVLILGLDNAGKTTFLEHIKLLYPAPNESSAQQNKRNASAGSSLTRHLDTEEESSSAGSKEPSDSVKILKGKRILPTVGQNTTTVRFKPSDTASSAAANLKNINLKFWDLGGQRSLRSMWSRYYRSCHGIIFIIDSTDTDRFSECYDTLMEIANDSSWKVEGGESVNVPILMLANKQDLPQAVDLVSLKTGVFIEVVSQLEATDSKLLPVSVLENQGLKESLEWLVTRLNYNKPNKKPEYR